MKLEKRLLQIPYAIFCVQSKMSSSYVSTTKKSLLVRASLHHRSHSLPTWNLCTLLAFVPGYKIIQHTQIAHQIQTSRLPVSGTTKQLKEVYMWVPSMDRCRWRHHWFRTEQDIYDVFTRVTVQIYIVTFIHRINKAGHWYTTIREGNMDTDAPNNPFMLQYKHRHVLKVREISLKTPFSRIKFTVPQHIPERRTCHSGHECTYCSGP
jgi:hypothetical protein